MMRRQAVNTDVLLPSSVKGDTNPGIVTWLLPFIILNFQGISIDNREQSERGDRLAKLLILIPKIRRENVLS